MSEILITEEYLENNPNHIFVFGDNTLRYGKGGAAKLRNFPNTYGFITKKSPFSFNSYYLPMEYLPVFLREIEKLRNTIMENPDKTFLISKIGSKLANKYKIFEEIIEPRIKNYLKGFKNVQFLW